MLFFWFWPFKICMKSIVWFWPDSTTNYQAKNERKPQDIFCLCLTVVDIILCSAFLQYLLCVLTRINYLFSSSRTLLSNYNLISFLCEEAHFCHQRATLSSQSLSALFLSFYFLVLDRNSLNMLQKYQSLPYMFLLPSLTPHLAVSIHMFICRTPRRVPVFFLFSWAIQKRIKCKSL